MIKMRVLKGAFLLATVAILFPSWVLADWKVLSGASGIQFVTIKKDNVGEISHFNDFKGKISNNKDFSLTINLASVETNIPIRNERMQTMLFDTNAYPTATVSANIASVDVQHLLAGQVKSASLEGVLTLHGEKQGLPVHILVTGLNKGKIQVVSTRPILVNANEFKLSKGIEKLREVAGLPSIAGVVPVTFQLILEKAD
ncbi:YceI family protein [Parasalinivibrio latis]|uniref:YceI family protein n=1 Tax=Parasalinivibrio latis TaxID=2952610 RepID=UPI0030E1A45A